MSASYKTVQWSDLARHGRKYAETIRAGESLAILHNGDVIATIEPVDPERARVIIDDKESETDTP